jgi:hypothetical protein
MLKLGCAAEREGNRTNRCLVDLDSAMARKSAFPQGVAMDENPPGTFNLPFDLAEKPGRIVERQHTAG